LLNAAFSWVPYLGKVLGPAADLLCAQAKDPPEPSPRFREAVTVVPFSPVKVPSGQPLPVLSLIEVGLGTGRVTRLAEALVEVRARLLGAVKAGSRDGLKLQEASFESFAEAVVKEAEQLCITTERTIAILAEPRSDSSQPGSDRKEHEEMGQRLKLEFADNGSATHLRRLALGILSAARQSVNEARATRPNSGKGSEHPVV
jgi:hypothetical protein